MLSDQVSRLAAVIGEHIAAIKGIPPSRIAPASSLVADLGMSSLDLAQLVAELELRFSVDPFAVDTSVRDIRTVEDLCRAYQRHVTPG